MRKPMALLAGFAGIVSCSGADAGACVSRITVGAGYTYCSNDWEKEECEEFQGGSTYHAGKTCKALGYTYYCARTFTYHMGSANCD